jgi:predicted HicB family RNase H-like nuclease
MRHNPKGVSLNDLGKVGDDFFGAARQTCGSLRIYKTPWHGDPRGNIQNDKAMVRAYQVKKVLNAIERLIAAGGDVEEQAMLQNDRYTYRITWSEEDGEYVGLCAEFASLSWLAPEPEAALQGIRQVVADVVADLQKNGEAVPEHLATKKYSGRFMVRVTPELHRQLALEAAEAGVSLNRLVSDKLHRAPC